MLLQKGVGHRGYWLATFAISAGGGQWWAGVPSKATVSTLDVTSSSKTVDLALRALINFAPSPGRNPAKKGCTCESPIRVQRLETTQVGWNGDDWVYASVRVRGLTRFHVALVRCVLSESNGNGGQAMRRAGHARLRRALGGSVPHRFPMRLVEIDRLIAVHGRARAGCPPQRGGLHFPLP